MPLQPLGLTFNSMTDAMFEPANWRRFKAFVVRVRERAEQAGAANRPDWARFSISDHNEAPRGGLYF